MLEAALSVFAEKGYARATLEEIAHRAEFGKGTLYNYFEGGKQAMLFAIFDEIFDGLVQLVEQSFDGDESEQQSIRSQMHGFIASSMQFFEERKEVFMLVMKEGYRMILSDDPVRAMHFQAQQQRVVDALIPHLEKAMQCGEMRTFHPEAIAHTLFGNINGIQMHLCVQDGASHDAGALTPTKAADFLTTLLMEGLLVEPDRQVQNGSKQPHEGQ